jgi:hypothetical protein
LKAFLGKCQGVGVPTMPKNYGGISHYPGYLQSFQASQRIRRLGEGLMHHLEVLNYPNEMLRLIVSKQKINFFNI